MNFKDDLAADIETFLNLDEFAENINVDGVELPAQIIKYTSEKSTRQNETYPMLHGDFITIYFRADTYQQAKQCLPKKNDWVVIDGKRYTVESSQEEFGIIKVEAAAYRQPKPGGLR